MMRKRLMPVRITKKSLTIATLTAFAAAGLGGCSTIDRHTDMGSQTESRNVELSKREADLAAARVKIEKEREALRAREAELVKQENMESGNTGGETTSQTNQQLAGMSSDDMFPPNPKPGECYARVLIPAQYEATTEQVLTREAGTKIETVPAKFVMGEEQVLLREASKKLVVVPASYETITEQVLVRPASSKFMEVPATYKKMTEKVLDKPAHTVWKSSSAALGAGANTNLPTRIDEDTGEIMCLVEVPATYKTVTKTVLETPASVKEVPIPAQYRTVKRTVLKTPPSTKEVEIPAEYGTVKVQKLASPAVTRELPIPAEYQTVTKRSKISEEKLMWRQVVCDINLTNTMVSKIQNAATRAGYYKGSIDGILGPMTLRAVNSWAKQKGLPIGQNYIPIETVKAMGVDI